MFYVTIFNKIYVNWYVLFGFSVKKHLHLHLNHLKHLRLELNHLRHLHLHDLKHVYWHFYLNQFKHLHLYALTRV